MGYEEVTRISVTDLHKITGWCFSIVKYQKAIIADIL